MDGSPGNEVSNPMHSSLPWARAARCISRSTRERIGTAIVFTSISLSFMESPVGGEAHRRKAEVQSQRHRRARGLPPFRGVRWRSQTNAVLARRVAPPGTNALQHRQPWRRYLDGE